MSSLTEHLELILNEHLQLMQSECALIFIW